MILGKSSCRFDNTNFRVGYLVEIQNIVFFGLTISKVNKKNPINMDIDLSCSERSGGIL